MRSTAEKAEDRKAKVTMAGAADAYDKLAEDAYDKLAEEVEAKTAPRERQCA